LKITQEQLKYLLTYDPNTGNFYWKNPKKPSMVGKLYGTLDKRKGYLTGKLLGKGYKLHRLACLYMTGIFPPEQIDHRNGMPSDNRWSNLRAVSNSINQKNTSRRIDNSSGVTGVNWEKFENKWKSQIQVDGTKIYLGKFEKFSDAADARKNAEMLYGFYKNHGREKQWAS